MGAYKWENETHNVAVRALYIFQVRRGPRLSRPAEERRFSVIPNKVASYPPAAMLMLHWAENATILTAREAL